MKKNTSITNKLAQYGAAAVAFLAIAPAAEAGVVYVNLDPDETVDLKASDYSMDLNGDGTYDFRFFIENMSGTISYYGYPVSYGLKIAHFEALNDNAFVGKSLAGSSGYTYKSVYRITPGSVINNEDVFVKGVATVALSIEALGSPIYAGGPWAGLEDSIFGFRLLVDSDTLYGWLRLSVVGSDASFLTIDDYAYNDTPGEAIFASSTTTSISDLPDNTFTIYTYGSTLFINAQTEATCNVYSMAGALVKSFTVNNGANNLDCNTLPTGYYTTAVICDKGSTTKKIFIKDN